MGTLRSSSGADAGLDATSQTDAEALRAHLRSTTLVQISRALSADLQSAREIAAAAADRLRADIAQLTEPGGRAGELGLHAGAALHDATLQLLDYVGGDAYGEGLSEADARRILLRARAELRRTIRTLGDDGDGDLLAGLRAMVEETRHHRAAVLLDTSGFVGELNMPHAGALIGATREALNNVHKHAKANAVSVRLRRLGGGVQVVVSDDGVGFDPEATRPGLGMRTSIGARLSRRGGTAVVRARPGRGTRVTLDLPHGRQA